MASISQKRSEIRIKVFEAGVAGEDVDEDVEDVEEPGGVEEEEDVEDDEDVDVDVDEDEDEDEDVEDVDPVAAESPELAPSSELAVAMSAGEVMKPPRKPEQAEQSVSVKAASARR